MTHAAPRPSMSTQRGPSHLLSQMCSLGWWSTAGCTSTPTPPGAFADIYTNGGKRLPLVCITLSPSAKKMSGANELRDSTWHLKQLAPHMDWYRGCYKINCIFPGTKLEITQRAINAEICLCSAKISDKKPIRQFLPYVLEWFFFFFKQIHVACNGLDQPRSSKETVHFKEVSKVSWVSCTSNHILDMPPKGAPSPHLLIKFHTEIMACQPCGQNREVPKVTSSWSREAKNVKFMVARQKNPLATATSGFPKHCKDQYCKISAWNQTKVLQDSLRVK